MTGYGQGSAEIADLRVGVDMRSVNNRFTDVRLRIPGSPGPAETAIRRKVLGRVRRGRVEISVKLERVDGSDLRPALDRALLGEIIAAARTLQDEYAFDGNLQAGDVLGVAGLFRSSAVDVSWDEEEVGALHAAIDAGLDALDADRCREGEVLRKDLLRRVERMTELAASCRTRATKMPALARDRLLERLRTLASEVELDPNRLAQEAAVQADRCDVTEELVRLEGHLGQAASLLTRPDGKPLGKRMEFLLQEIQRESNTLGSKSIDLALTREVLEMKAEIEKIREQVQNVE
jgi:uncharacterized protein (TIGR00255 family)